jgi:hypothetical protein
VDDEANGRDGVTQSLLNSLSGRRPLIFGIAIRRHRVVKDIARIF